MCYWFLDCVQLVGQAVWYRYRTSGAKVCSAITMLKTIKKLSLQRTVAYTSTFILGNFTILINSTTSSLPCSVTSNVSWKEWTSKNVPTKQLFWSQASESHRFHFAPGWRWTFHPTPEARPKAHLHPGDDHGAGFNIVFLKLCELLLPSTLVKRSVFDSGFLF